MSIEIKWFPPSWIQLKAGQKIIYIDPAYLRTYFVSYPDKIEFSRWPDPIDGLPEKLQKGNIILITHHHKDHCKNVTVNRLRNSGTVLIAPEKCVKELGSEIQVIQADETIEIGDIKVKAVHAYNLEEDSKGKMMHKKGDGVGYLLTIRRHMIYHAGDSDLIPEMKKIGKVDIALLPIGGKGFTMNLDGAVKAVAAIKPRVVIPIHRFKADPMEFRRKVEVNINIKVVPLDIGKVYNMK